MTKNRAHFEGKEALQHVIDARKKGKNVVETTHGAELPGHIFAGCDAARETAIVLVLLWIVSHIFSLPEIPIFSLFFIGFILWKTGRSATLGWSRLERLHRLIEEERWEIEHSRDQEKEELMALYRAKGFSGKLLNEVIDVLMADDNRLLQVMLEEEMGLSLETYEHPLKQASGAFLGTLFAGIVLGIGYFLIPLYGLIISGALIIAFSAGLAAKLERNHVFQAAIWNLSITATSSLCTYFLAKTLRTFL